MAEVSEVYKAEVLRGGSESGGVEEEPQPPTPPLFVLTYGRSPEWLKNYYY